MKKFGKHLSGLVKALALVPVFLISAPVFSQTSPVVREEDIAASTGAGLIGADDSGMTDIGGADVQALLQSIEDNKVSIVGSTSTGSMTWGKINHHTPNAISITEASPDTGTIDVTFATNTAAVDEATTLTISGDMTTEDVIKLRIIPSADAVITLSTASMTGTPNIYWDEQGFNKTTFSVKSGVNRTIFLEWDGSKVVAWGDNGLPQSLAIADLNDAATPSVLTIHETTSRTISNYQTTGADHVFTMPAAHVGGSVTFTVGDEFQVDIEPVSGANFILNGTAMAADEHIQNTADTLGDTIVGWVVNINGTLTWLFKSDNANWVEATP